MVAIKQQLVKSTNRISVGKNLINYITIHETANTAPGANAQAHANLQTNGNVRQASWHYQVDDRGVIQSYPDLARCWHAGGNGNYQSIGIEICVNSDGNFAKAVDNAIKLVKTLMARYNLNASRVVQHNFWTGKDCPRFLRNGSKGINWTQFKNKLNSASPPVSNYLLLQFGDTGDRVKLYQGKLKRAGYKIDVDGIFGAATLSAVKRFQGDNGLIVDGYLGPDTQRKINEVLKNTKDKEVDIMSQPFKPTSNTISKAVQDVIYSQSKKEWKKDTPYVSDEWRKKYLAGDMTISDAIGLIYVMIDRGAIELGNKDAPQLK